MADVEATLRSVVQPVLLPGEQILGVSCAPEEPGRAWTMATGIGFILGLLPGLVLGLFLLAKHFDPPYIVATNRRLFLFKGRVSLGFVKGERDGGGPRAHGAGPGAEERPARAVQGQFLLQEMILAYARTPLRRRRIEIERRIGFLKHRLRGKIDREATRLLLPPWEQEFRADNTLPDRLDRRCNSWVGRCLAKYAGKIQQIQKIGVIEARASLLALRDGFVVVIYAVCDASAQSVDAGARSNKQGALDGRLCHEPNFVVHHALGIRAHPRARHIACARGALHCPQHEIVLPTLRRFDLL